MKNIKKLIHWLNIILKWVWYINLVLAGGMIGFQLMNIFKPEKVLLAGYLGQFSFQMKQAGGIITENAGISAFFDTATGTPQVAIESHIHVILVLFFTLIAVGINLFYNYHFWKLSEAMDNSFKQGAAFAEKVTGYFRQIALFSLGVFVIGSLLSVAKIIFVQGIQTQSIKAVPVYDNFLLNFLWVGIALFIIEGIYKAGLELKHENELTI